MKGFHYLGYKDGDFPISENLSQTIVSLPMHPYLTKMDIDLIIKTLKNNE
jgi:dTDP-4-amino-4,6-dideoxygalactose transaminase